MDGGPAPSYFQVPTATTAPGTPSTAPPRPPHGPTARSFPPHGLGEDRGGRQPPFSNPDSPARSPERAAGARERQPRRGPRPSQFTPPATHRRPGSWEGARHGLAGAEPRTPTRAGAPPRSRPSLSVCTYKASLRPEPWKSTSGGAGEGRVLAPELLPGWSCQGLRGEARRGGAGRGLSEGSRKSAPGLVANPFCPLAPRFPKLRLYPLQLFDAFHSGHLIVQRRKPGLRKFRCKDPAPTPALRLSPLFLPLQSTSFKNNDS